MVILRHKGGRWSDDPDKQAAFDAGQNTQLEFDLEQIKEWLKLLPEEVKTEQ